MTAFLETSLGGVLCRVFDETRANGREGPSGVVVLCHGFGAPGTDLCGLAPEVCAERPALAERLRFVFPEAPIALPFGGRAWWEIDLARLEASLISGEPRVMRDELPAGLVPARRKLMGLVEEVCRQTRLPLSRVVLGGFSQGAMLATDVTLRLEEAPAALAILSGTLLAEAEWSRLAPRRAGLKVLMTHGRRDPILPYGEASALCELLKGAGLDVTFRPFDGAHTISRDGVRALAELLDGCLPDEAAAGTT